MELYTYSQKKLPYRLRPSKNGSHPWSHPTFTLTFKSPYASGCLENDSAFCRLITPQGLGRPLKLLIFLHGFSTSRKKMENYLYFIDRMARQGYTCAFLNLPYHLKRTPKGSKSGRELIYFDDEKTLRYFHQCVVDIKRLIDIMENFCLEDINICGLSMGSMVSVLAMAHEPRIEKGILLIGGGNWKEIHWHGILRFILKGNCSDHGKTDKARCQDHYSLFPRFLEELKKSPPKPIDTDDPGQLGKYLSKKCFLCDPLAFAHRIGTERILMVNARFDVYFSKKSTLALWEQLGKPEIYWLRDFHSNRILTRKTVYQKIIQFLKK